jgi:hypothetical protein
MLKNANSLDPLKKPMYLKQFINNLLMHFTQII